LKKNVHYSNKRGNIERGAFEFEAPLFPSIKQKGQYVSLGKMKKETETEGNMSMKHDRLSMCTTLEMIGKLFEI